MMGTPSGHWTLAFARLAHRRTRIAALVALAAAVHPARVHAQSFGVTALPTLAGEAEDRLRLRQLVGDTTALGFLLRSTSSMIAPIHRPGLTLDVIAPTVHVIRNSELPFSLNDGPLWAGRGWNEDVTAGLLVNAGRFRLVAAPTLVSSDNKLFQVIPYPQDVANPRNVWANPFHPLPESIDLPLRFGDRRVQRLDPGQSTALFDFGAMTAGVSTENEWWGPGIRNAIALSNNAPGFVHGFLRTTHPIRTRAGTFDARWLVGQLVESPFFDTVSTNDHRSLSGVAVTWTTPLDSGLTLGVARLVMATQSGAGFPLGAAFDVLRSVGHTDVDTLKPVPSHPRDQIFSTFARWVFPTAGFEAYVEWARFEEPRSFRDLLEYPEHSQGYTLGVQWAHPLRPGRTFRLQTEASYLEPDPSLRLRYVATTYTSRGVPQGFTNRGQTLGAAIGPGSSSQWLAGDVFDRHWRVGAYLSRIRWDNGVLGEPIVPQFKRQDVTLLGGLRGSVTWRGANLLVDFGHAARFNYLYQTYTVPNSNKIEGIDLLNNTLSVTLTTGLPQR